MNGPFPSRTKAPRPASNGRVEHRQVGAEVAIALLHPQGVEGAVAEGFETELGAGGAEAIPDGHRPVDGRRQLPAEFAGIADAGGVDRGGPDADRPGPAHRDRFVADLVGRGARGDQDVACPRPPQPDRREVAADVADLDRLVVRDVGPQPRQLGGEVAGAGHDPEAVVREARDGHVGHHPAALVAPLRVDDAPDGAVDVVRRSPAGAGRALPAPRRRSCRTTTGR